MDNFQNILDEANKCLNCKNPMCVTGCPVKTKIPEFIYEIKQNNLQRAYEILQENNIMSDVCSNVCPYEEYCSGHCIKGIKGEPVKIYMLEKYVNIWARENNIEFKYKKEVKNGYKAAIIGSGPAGLECALELAKKGFEVTIFEKENEIGGLLNYGIPGFRLPRNIIKKLTKRIIDLDIKINTNMEFGKDITINSLKKEFDVIFIGIGAGISSYYNLTDKKCNSIYQSDYILKEYNAKRTIENIGHVAIIGGGNVAIDSARAVIRMGAKSSTILYRRGKDKMPARNEELQCAIKDGAKILYNTKVLEANIENEEITNIKCIKTVTNGNNIENIENSEFTLDVDTVVFAIGLKPDKELLINEGILVNDEGLINIDENYMTNIEGVFAGGDSTQKKATVCMAIRDGKECSKNILNYFSKKY